MAPGLLKILIASMQQYLIMYITLHLFICMHFICIHYSFPKACGAYMLGYVPYITTGFTDFCKPVII